ncbi:heavy metal translocating P-type ATPase [Zhouia spongiae]|uniref:P-type Zn(2+) transporter n=1 Tax=Zhouia spongiae TaxID=2202721 RepID=A0ABY3YKW1_9FLAO|nr:heavy metal translocating P-type ATPase [Zhouia spongiae]UNY98475.1 heavy metal translocating P-type ATPase [Zhouia spongiae]
MDTCHHHHEKGIFGKHTELVFSIICGTALGLGYLFTYIDTIPYWPSLILYVASYFFGGFFTTKEAIGTLSKGGFEIDFLMLVAAIGAAILGEWAEGALLLFLFSLGHALEHFAMNKAKNSIASLADIVPKTALVKLNGVTKEIPIDNLGPGDVILIKPHTKIAADGIIIEGSSSINQAAITGESIPVEKTAVKDSSKEWWKETNIDPQHLVFSGTLNGNNTIEVMVTKKSVDSTLSRLIKLVNEAQTQKSPTQQFTDKFEKYFVPTVLILVVLLHFAFLIIDESFSESFYRAMAVLVAASPCALAISTPSAVLSGIARAAKSGVLIKGGRPLEDLGSLKALAFDKTGTLTEGTPKLTDIIPFEGYTKEELLKITVAVEQSSDHPLAKAIVNDGLKKIDGSDLPKVNSLEAIPGKGIKADLNNENVFIGNVELFENKKELDISTPIKETLINLASDGKTTMLISKGNTFVGILALMDIPRTEAIPTIKQLKSLGIKQIIMISGDHGLVASSIAKKIGLTDAWGELLPEEKVEAIKRLKHKNGKVAMVGDGVNDAPAMAHSTVGIAMGAAGSDVALETADIALMADSLDKLPFAIALSRKTKKIIKQNLFISLGMVAILIPLTITGIATIGPAVLMHEGSTLVVVFNALRLLAYEAKIT